MLSACAYLPTVHAADRDLIEKGAYLVHAAGCAGCHTDPKSKGAPFAGGRAFKTSFGTYYSPNITSHPVAGIGKWRDLDFVAALREGISPDGGHYFPVFPYTSYSRMRKADMLAIKAYLSTIEASDRANRDHDVNPPFGWRWTMIFWKWLFFEAGEMRRDPNKSPGWNRGAYLVEALAHCGECHTPRNAMGASKSDRRFAGTRDGPDGQLVPNITTDMATGIGEWDEGDIVTLLKDGTKPDYDDVQGSMEEVIEDGLKFLKKEDLSAIAKFLKSLPPIENLIEGKKK